MDKKNQSDYTVGYKKPPRHTQFKPGESGNRKGRPKQGETFADVITKQVRKKVTVSTGNIVRKVPMLVAIAMKHISKAAGGDPKSTAIVLDFLKSNESNQNDNLGELLQQFQSIHASREAENHVPTRSKGARRKKRNLLVNDLTTAAPDQTRSGVGGEHN